MAACSAASSPWSPVRWTPPDVAIVVVSLVVSAQPKDLTTADLPPHLTRDLGAQPVESFAKVIDAELRAADKAPR
jgi:hypothetical protein